MSKISYKSVEEIELIRESSLLVSKTLAEIAKVVAPGVKTIELNKLAEKLGMMCAVYKDMQIARLVKLRIAATSKLRFN